MLFMRLPESGLAEKVMIGKVHETCAVGVVERNSRCGLRLGTMDGPHSSTLIVVWQPVSILHSVALFRQEREPTQR